MKISTYIILIIIGFTLNVSAQHNGWFTEEKLAKEYATNNNIPILLIFGGSDWCRPCMMLKKDILLSEQFSKYFPEKFALLYLDFPVKKKNKLSPELTIQNDKLAEKFNKSGAFPNIVFIDINEKKLGTLFFKNQTPAEFILDCEKLLSSLKN
jgi:thioredoxin-related protein